jgi:1-acyl-sn-glycerol-3-phosphate acyltransferase
VIIVDEHRPFGVRTVVRALRSGQNVLMFPEGSIGEEGPKAWQAGFLWLVRRCSPDVIVARIDGAHRSRLFSAGGREFRPRIRVTL